MKRYKVTYRYRKDGSAGIYKTDMMYVSSAEFAIEELKRHYIDEANDSVHVKAVAVVGDRLEIRYYDSDPDDEAEHETIFDDFRAERI